MEIKRSGRCAFVLAALLAVTLLPACDSKSPTAPTLPEGPVAWTVLLNSANAELGGTSGLADSTRQVIRTEAAFIDLWAEIFEPFPGGPTVPRPEVDFSQDMVLAVASGEKPNTCFGISVTAAISDGTDLTVTVTETVDDVGCVCGQALVQPVEVARVPRADEVFFASLTVSECSA